MLDIGFEYSLDDDATTSKGHELAVTPNHPEFLDYFFCAVHAGRLDVLKSLLSSPMSNIDVLGNKGLTKGMTALGIAAQKGYPEIAQFLIDNKANVNAQDNAGKTPLLIAAQTDTPASFEVAKILLSHQADTERPDNSHNTPLSWAIYRSSPKMMQILLEHNADPNRVIQTGLYKDLTPLAASICTNNGWQCDMLLKHDSHIDTTVLKKAVINGTLNYIKKLWPQLNYDDKAAVIINSITLNKINILEYALAKLSPEERKAALHSSIDGVTPLTYCFDHNLFRCAKILLNNDVELINKDSEYSKDSVTLKYGTAMWREMLQTYLRHLKTHEKTLTLTEMAANTVYKISNGIVSSCGLPEELQTLCQNAPLRFKIQSELKPLHVRNFLSDLADKSLLEINGVGKQIKRKRNKSNTAISGCIEKKQRSSKRQKQ